MMKRIATRSPSNSCKKIRVALLVKGTNVRHMTVSRRLSNELGLQLHKLDRKPRLTTGMKFTGLDLAKKYEDWTAEHWGLVLAQKYEDWTAEHWGLVLAQ